MAEPDVEVMVGQGAGAAIVEITLAPGEVIDGDKAFGHLLVRVRGQLVKRYPACAGPPPGKGRLDRGGHTADPTPPGRYVLAAPVRYTTASWPTSTVPWGAPLRRRPDGEVEFSPDDGKTWKAATGPAGVFTTAWIAFEERGRAAEVAAQSRRDAGKPGHVPLAAEPLGEAQRRTIEEGARRFFEAADGALLPTYRSNDFGPLAWPMQRRTGTGRLERTALFVHTTPQNEREAEQGLPVVLTNSHGCVHIRPADRDEMKELGYLQAGVAFVVLPYGPANVA